MRLRIYEGHIYFTTAEVVHITAKITFIHFKSAMRRGGPILVLACTISSIANLKMYHR